MQIGDQHNPFSAKNLEGGGKIAVGTTAVLVDFSITTKSIAISADKDNTEDIYIGKAGVTNAGVGAMTYLSAGDSITLDYDDVNVPIYVVAAGAGQYFWQGALL